MSNLRTPQDSESLAMLVPDSLWSRVRYFRIFSSVRDASRYFRARVSRTFELWVGSRPQWSAVDYFEDFEDSKDSKGLGSTRECCAFVLGAGCDVPGFTLCHVDLSIVESAAVLNTRPNEVQRRTTDVMQQI